MKTPSFRGYVQRLINRRFLLALVIAGCLSPHLPAATNWSAEGSLLAFTRGDAVGGAIGASYRRNQFSMGVDVLFHNHSDTFGSGTSTYTNHSRLVNTGLILKYIIPFTAPAGSEVYLGGGAGFASISADHGVGSDNLGKQLMAGLQIPLGASTNMLKLGWRYLAVDHIGLIGGSYQQLSSHAFELGVTLRL